MTEWKPGQHWTVTDLREFARGRRTFAHGVRAMSRKIEEGTRAIIGRMEKRASDAIREADEAEAEADRRVLAAQAGDTP